MNALDRIKAALPAWNRRTLTALLGYSAFFSFFFLLFAYWSFPYGRLRGLIAEQARTAIGYELSIGELSPHWLSGVHLTEVRLTKPAASADAEPQEIKLEEATVRAAILPFLLGKKVVQFWASDGTGEAEGTVTLDDESFAVEATLEGLDLDAIGLGDFIGISLRGVASGTLALSLPETLTEAVLQTDLTISELAVGDGKTKARLFEKLSSSPMLRGGLIIDRINAGTLTLQMESDKGVATFKTFSIEGPDLKLKGTGSVRLARPLGRSRVDATLAVNITDAYRDRNDRTKAMFQLMDMVPDIKRARSADGTLTFQLSGPLMSLRGVPVGAPAGGQPAAGPRVRRKR